MDGQVEQGGRTPRAERGRLPGDREFDIVAIGGGTAGLVTAAGSAGLGARVALVERDRLGGDCLWTGCVPSKALIGSARLAESFRRAGDFGLEAAEPSLDGGRILESVRNVRSRVQPHDDPERFRAMGVEVVEASASFLSDREVEAGGRVLRARRFVIATGSRPTVPPVPGLEEAGYFTNETAFDRAEVPRSVAIIGGGPIGVEFAQAYRRLGVDVTLIELEERILPREDPDLSDRLRRILEREGTRVLTGTRVAGAERPGGAGRPARLLLDRNGASRPGRPNEEGVEVHSEAGDRSGAARRDAVEAWEILVAAGRRPNVEGLGLERAGVEVRPEGVVVDDRLRTTRPHIYAAGDVTGGLLFTHVADHEARTVVRNALFPLSARPRYDAIPWCTFTEPELAHVGLTEPEARDRHGDGVRAFSYDLKELDRALTDRAAEGMVKLVVDRKGRLLGGHILAPSAGTMITEVALAMAHGIRIGKLSDLVHPYPTMSEGIRRTADAYMRSKLTGRTRRWLDRWFALSRRVGL